MKYEPMGGESIDFAAKAMTALANERGEAVTANFNDIELTAQPGESWSLIVAFYNKESQYRSDVWHSSTEYAEQQRKAEAKERQRMDALSIVLALSPAAMTLKDADFWAKTVEANKDGYGGAVMTYAERWARLMEGTMSNGETLESCADRLSSLADSEGITGFMYGAAVATLSKVWIHGEGLRRWHNLKTQIRDEGVKANETGGVLNPALLSIGER